MQRQWSPSFIGRMIELTDETSDDRVRRVLPIRLFFKVDSIAFNSVLGRRLDCGTPYVHCGLVMTKYHEWAMLLG